MSDERPTLMLLRRIMALPGTAATPTQRLILTVYAYHADARMMAWPSHATVAAESGLCRQTVAACVQDLAAAGLLQEAGSRRGSVKVWRMNLPEPAEDAGGRPETIQEGVAQDDRGCRPGRQGVSSTATQNRVLNRKGTSPARARGGNAEGVPPRGAGERANPIQKKPTTATNGQQPPPRAAVPHQQQTASAQLPLFGSATEHVEAVLAGLEARDREEVAAVLRAWLGQEHGARAVATWARQAAGWPRGRLASKACPRAYVEACVARVARQVADEAARESASRAADEVRTRRAAREEAERQEAEALGAREEEALREAFEALAPAERDAVVADALAGMSGPVRAAAAPLVSAGRPMDSAFMRLSLAAVMARRTA